MHSDSGSSMQNIIVIVLIIVVFTVYYMFFDSTASFTMDDNNEAFTLYGTEDTTSTILFDDILSLDLVEDPDYGEPIDGGTKSNNNYGTWESDTLGIYESYVKTSISDCIVVSDQEKTVVFNYENQTSTKNLYESMVEVWKKQTK